jgi:hypothetical protein
VLYFFDYSFVLVLFLVSATLIHVLLLRVSWFHAEERYRVLGDLVFGLAGVLLLV